MPHCTRIEILKLGAFRTTICSAMETKTQISHTNALSISQQKAAQSHGVSLQTFLASLTASGGLFIVELITFICLKTFLKSI